MLAVLAPGQGAQKFGFLAPWLAEPSVADLLGECSVAAGRNLAAAGTSMPDEAITDTAVAQPLIVAAGICAASLLDLRRDLVFAGHSVGEFTAACLAGALDPNDTMRLVTARGRAMAAASADRASGMAAVLGGDVEVVTAAISRIGCVAANHNGSGQIVAAGTTDAITALIASPPAGARVRPLAVAGAFHSPLMEPARSVVAATAAEVTPTDPTARVLSNRDGQQVGSGAELLQRLVEQICLPVRWDLCMASLIALGVTAAIELPPAGTLTAMLRRMAPDVTTLALNTPDDLPAARDLITAAATMPVSAA